MNPLVLICSQDAEFYLIYSHILRMDGFASELASGLEDALAMAGERRAQAVVLDCQPAGAAASTICTELKRDLQIGDLPVIALIAPGAGSQQLDLLKAGIDESFLRPIAPAKLLDYLRAKTVSARPEPHEIENGRSLCYGDVEMRVDTFRVRCDGQEMHLGPIEFNLLRHLLEHPGKVFSRGELIGAVWPDNIHVGERTVDVHISRLRRTLETSSPRRIIRTIRSAGYSLEDPGG
ncbi:response regulator transcription factor [Sinorhizobium prairiense]|uniref:response regulator transcription factor n=1 Tax=unclassified Sinorhizobium TaxID=2613772 RepID=UPI0023D7BBC2|nr:MULTISPECIES: response regulator transcription factor [unclassified Sinorhizobium]WEJ08568.1 response regulator transcription factor [Sinorhizobium sp. M103]WEJ13928.1 response regulator transcription factor [Sinorhizobium sp. K101]WEJ35531.1 response regulator transcription factor [Sinorhizobium sp. C101]